jgi:glutaredoxin
MPTDKDVTVYALSTCIHCKKAKDYLAECGISYESVHVDQLTGNERKTAIETVKKLNPSVSFPTLLIGDTVVVGFDRAEIDKALGR